jgi:hypothetical protein
MMSILHLIGTIYLWTAGAGFSIILIVVAIVCICEWLGVEI